MVAATMAAEPLNLAELDERLSIVRENLRELTEQAAAYAGAADEELMATRIAEEEARLEQLTKQRDAILSGSNGGR